VTGSLPLSAGDAGLGGVSVLVGAVLATQVHLSRRTLVQHAVASIGGGMAAFVTAWPMNTWLIHRGIKEAM
jgi:hypothetical protein